MEEDRERIRPNIAGIERMAVGGVDVLVNDIDGLVDIHALLKNKREE